MIDLGHPLVVGVLLAVFGLATTWARSVGGTLKSIEQKMSDFVKESEVHRAKAAAEFARIDEQQTNQNMRLDKIEGVLFPPRSFQ